MRDSSSVVELADFTKVRQGRIYYASTSQRLVEDVRQLLLRLGISSRGLA